MLTLWKTALFFPLIPLLVSCGETASTNSTENTATKPEAALSSRAAHGKALFLDKCTQCHRLNREMIGPALAGSIARWNNDTARLKRFIQNSEVVITEGDPYAVELYNRWGKTRMTLFTELSEEDLAALVEYIGTAGAAQ